MSSALLSATPTHSRSPSAASAAAARRVSAPRARQPPTLRPTTSRPRARAAPTAPEPVDRNDETRGLAAARVDAKRAVRSRADVLALFERGVGCRRTPRERSLRPPSRPSCGQLHLDLEPAQHHPRPSPQAESVVARRRCSPCREPGVGPCRAPGERVSRAPPSPP